MADLRPEPALEPADPAASTPGSMRGRARRPFGRGLRTRLTEPASAVTFSPWSLCHVERAATAPAGSRNHARIDLPSTGNAVRSIALWTAIRARFVRPSATMTQTDTVAGPHPNGATTSGASRRFRSDHTDQLVDIRDVRLELDHEQGPPSRVPRQDVDDAALGVDRERRLGSQHPTRQLVAEHPCHELVELRVPGVQESVEVAGPPPCNEVHPDIERTSHLADRLERQLVEVAALDPRDRRRGQVRGLGEVDLAPSLLQPDRSNDRSEPLVIHQAADADEGCLSAGHPAISRDSGRLLVRLLVDPGRELGGRDPLDLHREESIRVR